MRVLAIGAHPDDCDLCFGGTAVKLARAGHEVKFISATNGDTGHYGMGGGQLARRRYDETQESRRISGIAEYEVFDIHNNGLTPDIPTRERFIRAIREWNPDLVVGLSWGGFLSQKLRGRRKVLVNPEFHISRLMRLIMGTVEYLSPRRDGALSFEITEEDCHAYRALEAVQFDGPDAAERSLTLGLFADSDKLAHCGDEFAVHYPGMDVSYPGVHLPTYPEMKLHIVPAIRGFLQDTGL